MAKNMLKRNLLTSIVATALSASMLVGTTFAWFTDSVTSNNNVIQTGNLDVELYYQNDETTENWTKVGETTNVFKKNTLWEPGHVEVVKLKVVNEGTLALKYQLGVNVVNEVISKNVLGGDLKLSDHIKYGIVEGNQNYTREQAIDEVNDYAKPLKEAYSKASTLLKEQSQIITMVVYMPESVGNEANYAKNEKVPAINLGINLVATQVAYEEDIFGDDYDAAAWDYWDGQSVSYDWYDSTKTELTVRTAADLAGLAQIVNGTAKAPVTTYAANATTIKDSFKNKTITLEADVDLRGWLWTPIGTSTRNAFYGTFDGNGHTIKDFSLKCASGNYGAGFFGNLLGGSAIKNVVFEDVSANMSANVVGVAAGYLYGSATFENVHVKNVDVHAFGKVGGILGMAADPGAHTITMKNCSVEGIVGGAYNVGGLIGLVLQGVTVNLENCGVEVKFILKDNSYNKPYKQLDNGSWVWAYDNTSNYAAVAKTYCYYDAAGNEFSHGDVLIKDELEVVVTTSAGLKGVVEAALANGEKNITVDAQGENIGTLNYGLSTALVPAGTELTIKNATIQGKSYGNGVDGTVIFENCTFTHTGAYSIHFDSGSGDVVFNNCILQGWCSFGSAINSVTMNNCKIEGNATYGIVRFYQKAELNNCVIDCKNAELADRYHDGVSVADDAVVALNNCEIVYANFERANGGMITVNGIEIVTDNDMLTAAVANGATKVLLANGEYDLNGNQKNGLTLVGVGENVKVANNTKYASGKAIGAIWQAINLENVTITNTVYTMADGGNATFTNVYFAAGFRQGYGTSVVFTNCTFGSNSEGYALHFQTDSASAGGKITLNGCKFEGGKVHLGGKRAYEFTNCDFAAGTDFQVWSNITLEGCTVDGVAVTAENVATVFPKLDMTKVTLK